MTLVERYIFGSTTTAFLGVLGALTSVIWITQALRSFDLLTSKGQTFWIFMAVTGLTIPSLIMLITPIALFIAVLQTLNKLNGDSELIVMCAAGAPPGKLLRPFLVLTLLATLLDGYMSVYSMPWSFRVLRDLLTQVRADFITNVVRPGQFTTLDQGFIFHYREKGPNGELYGIFMQDRRVPAKTITYVAEMGQTFAQDDQNYLKLFHGNVQRQSADAHDASIIVFKSYTIDLAQFASQAGGKVILKPRERTTAELLNRDHNDPYVSHYEGRFRAELNDRLASPLYTAVAAIIGFAALGQARTTRQGRGASMFAAILSFGFLRLAGIGASTLSVRSRAGVFLDYAVPLGAVLVGLVLIFGLPRLSFAPRPRMRPLAAT